MCDNTGVSKQHIAQLVALTNEKQHWGKYSRRDLSIILTKDCGYYVSEEHVRMVLRSRGLLDFTKKPGGIIQTVPSSLKGDIEMKKPTNDQVREVIQAERVAKQAKEKGTFAERKYKLLQQEYDAAMRELEALTQIDNGVVRPLHIKPRLTKKENEAVPVIVLSDWHIEEKVDPRTVSGKNRYTLAIAEQRCKHIAQSALKLIEEKSHQVHIDTVAVFLIGDFITGNIHDENVENAQLQPVEAILRAQEMVEGLIQFLLDHTTHKLNFYCKVGNHSRITRKVHASTEMGNSLELGMYVSLYKHFKDNERVSFHIEPSYYSIVNILGTKVRFHHGHAVSYGGGIGGLHIPLRKSIKSWNETERADFDIMGHYHSFQEHATLRYIVNGSLIGYSAYAERIKAILEPPIQGFCLIHKKYGPTSLTPIFAE